MTGMNNEGGMSCPADSIGGAKVGDIVKMKVDSIENGMATLSHVPEESGDDMNKEPSTISKMSKVFAQEDE